jgi:4-amino-4-deoxy-L-arabinose transferase-like glycosyltransferase
VRQLRRIPAVVFAGDSRVWRAALVVAIPLALLTAFYCLRPVDYYTGTNNVEADAYIAETAAGAQMCVHGLHIPSGTGRVRLQLISRTRERPRLKLALTLASASAQASSPVRSPKPARPIEGELAPAPVPASRVSVAVFALPHLAGLHGEQRASLCVRSADLVNWAGTPLPAVPANDPATVGGRPVGGRIAVWYLPRSGGQRSYLSGLGSILARASLFRPGFVGPWLYVLLLFALLPLLALGAVRCLALAASGSASRKIGLALFVIAALNFACWALITPPFQAPDEVDHFAYTQYLAERGEAPSQNPGSPLARWSSSETVALEGTDFPTDHQVGDSRPPWTSRQEREYRAAVTTQRPSGANGGGNETAATHGPIYYAALAPAYLLAPSSPLDQLTLMRLTSALIGALTVLFAYLLVRELAPGRPWLAVLSALLVAYQPMYGFISGAVNNDVGVNAGAAALEFLLIRMLRRGLTVRSGLLTPLVLILLPLVKGTAYALYPVAAIAILAALWRHHRRPNLAGWATFALTAIVLRVLSTRIGGVFRPASGTSAATTESGTVSGSTSQALAHPLGYLAYLWQVFLPRLSFMAPHFEGASPPAFVIFDERGWGAFGWYDVFFPHWVYVVLLVAMLLPIALGIAALVRESQFVRRHALELGVLALMPIAVVSGVEAAFYTTGVRPAIAEFGRYAFPAIVPLAAFLVGSLHAFGRRRMLYVGAGLLVAMLALSYAAQLTTLTGFYA